MALWESRCPVRHTKTEIVLKVQCDVATTTAQSVLNEKDGIRAGPAIKGFKRRVGHAPINFRNLDLIFGHGVVHALFDALSFGPVYMIYFPRDT